jgi:hypothetical protein
MYIDMLSGDKPEDGEVASDGRHTTPVLLCKAWNLGTWLELVLVKGRTTYSTDDGANGLMRSGSRLGRPTAVAGRRRSGHVASRYSLHLDATGSAGFDPMILICTSPTAKCSQGWAEYL